MPIDQAVIDQVKHTDLLALVQAKGIALKKNGKGYFGLCPFHADNNPSLSVNPSKNLWQCFGCGAAGDAIRFVELFDQVPFAEAVARLAGNRRPAGGRQTGQRKSRAPGRCGQKQDREKTEKKLNDRLLVQKIIRAMKWVCPICLSEVFKKGNRE